MTRIRQILLPFLAGLVFLTVAHTRLAANGLDSIPKESLVFVESLDAQGKPHYRARGSNQWRRERLDTSTIALVLGVVGGLLGMATLLAGIGLRLPRFQVLVPRVPVPVFARRLRGQPLARAGPSASILLSVDRR